MHILAFTHDHEGVKPNSCPEGVLKSSNEKWPHYGLLTSKELKVGPWGSFCTWHGYLCTLWMFLQWEVSLAILINKYYFEKMDVVMCLTFWVDFFVFNFPSCARRWQKYHVLMKRILLHDFYWLSWLLDINIQFYIVEGFFKNLVKLFT